MTGSRVSCRIDTILYSPVRGHGHWYQARVVYDTGKSLGGSLYDKEIQAEAYLTRYYSDLPRVPGITVNKIEEVK